jgi:hypothetical protein
MSRDLNEMTDAEFAEWQYAHRDELDAEEGEPVDVEFAPQVSVTMSFRLSGAEADAIRDAAKDAGVSVSEWIRGVCAEAVDPDEGTSARRDVETELAEAERQLDAMRERLEAARSKNRGGRTRIRKVVKKQAAKKAAEAARRPSRRTRG